MNDLPLSIPEKEHTIADSAVELSRHRVVVVIPAFNEDRFIGSVVIKVLKHPVTVIVVDDGSQDDTAAVAGAAGATVIRHDENLGKGAALNTGLGEARKQDPGAVVLLDADGQHIPEELGQLLSPLLENKADLVLGSRYIRGVSVVPRHRIWGHWAFNWITRLGSGIGSTDSQSGFRALSPRALQVLSFSSRGFSVESEMQYIIREHDLRLVEVPITIQYVEKPKRNVIQHGLLVLNGILRLTGQYRPLLFFGVPGFFLLLAGFIWGWRVVDIYRHFQNLAVGYTMISLLLTIIGMVTLTTGIILHSMRGLLTELFTKMSKRLSIDLSVDD